MSRPLAIQLYRAATTAVGPAVPSLLTNRVRKGKEDPKRLSERLANSLPARGDQPVVWLHGASVGETMMLARIVDVLAAARPQAHCIVTSQTLASADILAKRLPANARHQMAPIDTPGAVRRFLDHWKPDIAVFAESEIWPNMIIEASERQIPLCLINARMTRASIENWLRWPQSAEDLFGRFDFIGAADELTAIGIGQMINREVTKPGNLKLDAPAPTIDRHETEKLRAQIGDRRIWLAASTHAGDETIALAAHAAIRTIDPTALLIIAPRHLKRVDEIVRLVSNPETIARRSLGQIIHPKVSVYIADTMGELGNFFSIAPVTVMGGGFTPGIGGHNPIEPARLGSYVMSGQHVENFAEAYAAIEQHNAGQLITTTAPRDVANLILQCWQSKRTRTILTTANAAWLPAPDGALAATIEQILIRADLGSPGSPHKAPANAPA